MKSIAVTIKGKRWKAMVVDDRAYRLKFGGKLHSQACCVYNHSTGFREIVFRKRFFNMDTVIHELTHAYLSYRCFEGMSYGQIEEAVCEEMGRSLGSMRNQSNRIYRELK